MRATPCAVSPSPALLRLPTNVTPPFPVNTPLLAALCGDFSLFLASCSCRSCLLLPAATPLYNFGTFVRRISSQCRRVMRIVGLCVCAVQRPLTDRRQYRYVVLSNGLRALLVHEPDCDEAAVSLRVGVGSASDPREVQGLAHFTEHMLFQGSSRFPGGHSFFDFVHLRGGKANAYTSKFSTVLTFSIGPKHLKPAIDRMADIFLSPELKPEAVHKEVHAVHAEYQLRFTDDAIRFAHFSRQSKLATPFSNFSVGNLHSLLDIPKAHGLDITQEMKQFHSKWRRDPIIRFSVACLYVCLHVNPCLRRALTHVISDRYAPTGSSRKKLQGILCVHEDPGALMASLYSSNLMTSVIVGNESLDGLENLAVSYLGRIPNKNTEAPRFKECSLHYQPFASEELKTFTVLAPQSDTRQLRFLFALPPQKYAWDSKPLLFVRQLIGLQGKGSLVSRLRKLGLVTDINSSETAPEYCTLLDIRFLLTEKGLEKKSISTIGDLFFLYLRAIRSLAVEEWRYAEMAKVQEQEFQFADIVPPYNLTQMAAESLNYVPVREVLAGDILMYRFDRDIVMSLIDNYLNPNNLRVYLLDKARGTKGTQVEPWYSIRYEQRPLEDSLLRKWMDRFSLPTEEVSLALQQENLSLPLRNPFVAQSLKLEQHDNQKLPVHPKLLRFSLGHICNSRETAGSLDAPGAPVSCNVFHKRDTQFGTPKTVMSLGFYFSPKHDDPVRQYLMTVLYSRLAEFSITEAFDSAHRAGISALLTPGVRVSGTSRPFGVVFHAFGFSEHLPHLVHAVASCLRVEEGQERKKATQDHEGTQLQLEACPFRPFLREEFVKATWDWLEVASRVAAASRSPSSQAGDALKLSVATPYFDPETVLQGVKRLKASYTAPAMSGTYWQSAPEADGDAAWHSRLYHDIVEWGELMWKEVHVEGLIQGAITNDAASKLLTSVLTALPIDKTIGAEAAQALVQVSRLETISPLRHSAPTRIPLRTLSSPIRRLFSFSSLEARKTEMTSAVTNAETGQADAHEAEIEGSKTESEVKADKGANEIKGMQEDIDAEQEGEGPPEEAEYAEDGGYVQEGGDAEEGGALEEEEGAGAEEKGRDAEESRDVEDGGAVHDGLDGVGARDADKSGEVEDSGDAGEGRDAEGTRDAEKARAAEGGDEALQQHIVQNDKKAHNEIAAEESQQRNTDKILSLQGSDGRAVRLSLTRRNSNPFDVKNHALLVVQAGPVSTVREKALAYLVQQWMSQEFFNILRTEEQLGYLTHMTTLRLEGLLYYCFSITTVYDPTYVHSRISAFLESHRQKRLMGKKLEELKEGGITFWKQKPKNLIEDFSRDLNQIKRREYIFDIYQEMAKEIQQVVEGQIEAFRETTLFTAPSLAIHIYSQIKASSEQEARSVRENVCSCLDCPSMPHALVSGLSHEAPDPSPYKKPL
ncbi:rhoptry metalloprotease toxolysin [Cyclospora cayetanensis]|uniref:Rhoptry metalloprotease toxolysin n=1 Tax=Cyclospora cayetanensis TaxID=88456 RepID=A0A1D3D1S5_9EIME|nr:rhoptry metalloprotease toxolysin [Cyclospora cayetanensis]